MRTYLGDGVYISTEEGRVVLYTHNGIQATNIIFLDHSVLVALKKSINEILNDSEDNDGD